MTAGPDYGQADPALAAALASGEPQRIFPVLEDARLLVGVIAMPGADHASEGEMALALLESATGERALPAFTCLDALARWNPEARPVPRSAREVIAYAVAESLSAVVIDPGSANAWTLECEQLTAEPAPRDPAPPVRRWRRRRA